MERPHCPAWHWGPQWHRGFVSYISGAILLPQQALHLHTSKPALLIIASASCACGCKKVPK